MTADLILNDSDRAQLMNTISSQGWKIIHQIMELEAEKFQVALLNVKPGNKEEREDKWFLAKAAAQVVAGILQRLQVEMELYRADISNNIVIPDITEEVLDYGDTSEEELI